MKTRWIPVLGAVLLMVPLIPAQQKQVSAPRTNPDYEKHRVAAVQMNELAGHLRSLDDSRRFVSMIAAEFADELPPEWATESIQERIAEAEYRSATEPAGLIPEQRVADAWNRYVQTIGAPSEALVSVAEIHNLRDGDYATAQVMWKRGNQTIWTMPSIYALAPDGKVADGCRAVEALRVVWDIANQFENLRAARERVQKGILVSDWVKASADETQGQVRGEVRFSVLPENPVEAAERRYASEQGVAGLSSAIEGLIDGLFSSFGRN